MAYFQLTFVDEVARPREASRQLAPGLLYIQDTTPKVRVAVRRDLVETKQSQ